MKNFWYRLLSRSLTALYYHRIQVINPQHLPGSGPILFVALHRNGAVDGYVYKSVIPTVNFLISVQLRRNLLSRVFFGGIEVIRSKDRKVSDTHLSSNGNAALQACVDYVKQGKALVILPEGSSDLGPRHLPFHKGAARILAQLVTQPEFPLSVIPLAIHYEQAWTWQSDVEVVVGEPINTTLPSDISSINQVNLLHERIVHALETIAVQAENADVFVECERIAYAATLGSKRSYFSALKALERGMPDVASMSSKLEAEIAHVPGRKNLWYHQGVPLMPMGFAWAYPLIWVTLLPIITLTCVLNAPPLVCSWWAGKRFSDGNNTIALWRLLVGFPCLLLWIISLLVAALWSQKLLLWLVYVAISALGVKFFRRFQKITVSLHNWGVLPELRQPLLRWRDELETFMRARNV